MSAAAGLTQTYFNKTYDFGNDIDNFLHHNIIDKNIFAVGESFDPYGFNFSLFTMLSSNGDTMWSKKFHYTSPDFGGVVAFHSIELTNGTLVANGAMYDSTELATDIFLHAFNMQGDSLWFQNLDAGYNDRPCKMLLDKDGGILLLGYYYLGDSDSSRIVIIKKGDLLLTIRPDIYQSIVEQAEAALNQAKAALANAKARQAQMKAQFENATRTYERNMKLYEQNVLSQADFDNAVAAFKTAEGEMNAADESVKAAEYSVKSAEAGLKEARDNLTKTKIYAPMAGILSRLNVKKGERVVGTVQFTGTEMLTIADLGKMEVRVDVSENDITRVSVGDTAAIEVDAFIDKEFRGVVKSIANSANTGNALTTEQVTNFTVKISILPESYRELVTPEKPFPFKPGMSATAEIKTDLRKDALSVPIQCVTIREEEEEKKSKKEETGIKEEIVFVYENEKVKSTKVKTGIQDDKYIEIKEGLNENQEVVSGPYRAISRTLKDGAEVKKVEKLKGEE
ncbi:MAG TPA: efflux RND transporter periplasmic adaptor subunit [Chitinophagales bacterium]|nr:efflux RND transporter periplasmic adaptor subunit [Chitinophagales bacterium]